MNAENTQKGFLPGTRQKAQDYRRLGLDYLDELPSYCGISDIDRIGYSVDECAQYVMRLAAVKKQCVLIAAARMPDTPELELKVALAKWMWEDATQFRLLEERLTELRSNKFAIDKVLDYQLGDLLGEILGSPGSLELCVGLFDVLSPAISEAIRIYLAETQPLVDAPTIRILKGILAEEKERLELGCRFVSVLARKKGGIAIRSEWKEHFGRFLAAARGILGRDSLAPEFLPPAPRASPAYRPSHDVARDQRFTVVIPKVCPKAFADDLLRRTMWSRSQELSVAETVALILYEWEDLPSEAIVDLARQCWDETRHALFGQVALEQQGIPLARVESWVGFPMHALAESPQKVMADRKSTRLNSSHANISYA